MMFNRSLPAYVHDLEIGYGELDAPWADEPRTPPRRRVDPLPTALIDSVIVSLVNLRSLSIDHTDGLVDLIPLHESRLDKYLFKTSPTLMRTRKMMTPPKKTRS